MRPGRSTVPAGYGARWVARYLRRLREARGHSAPAAIRELRSVPAKLVENYEHRGPPQSLAPLLAYALSIDAPTAAIERLGGNPTADLIREGHPVADELAAARRRRGELLEPLSASLPFEFSRPSVNRIERGHVSLAVQRFVRYAVHLGADLRLIAELMTVPDPARPTAFPTELPISSLLNAIRAPARCGRLSEVLWLASAVESHPDFAGQPVARERLLLSLSIAFGLDRRWQAASYFASCCNGSFAASVQRAFIHCETECADTTLGELGSLEPTARDLGPAATRLLKFQLGRAALRAGRLRGASLWLESVAKGQDDLDLTVSAWAELALARSQCSDRRATQRAISAATRLAEDCDPAVAAYRKAQLARAALRVDLPEAMQLARESLAEAEAIGFEHGRLLALMRLQDLAIETRNRRELAALDSAVSHTALRVHLDEPLWRRVRRTARRLQERSQVDILAGRELYPRRTLDGDSG